MVIQEAFVYGRPLLVSNIGGMAEKVDDGVDGYQVSVGNATAWAATFLRCAQMTDAWDARRQAIRKPLSHVQVAQAHLALINTPMQQEQAA